MDCQYSEMPFQVQSHSCSPESGKTAFVQRIFNQLWSAGGDVIPFYYDIAEKNIVSGRVLACLLVLTSSIETFTASSGTL